MNATITAPARSKPQAGGQPVLGVRTPKHPSEAMVADLDGMRDGRFDAGWSSLAKRLSDHGLPAPSRPWFRHDDAKMRGAILAASAQPGFMPVAKSTVAAANELPLAMAKGDAEALQRVFTSMVWAVQEQSWAAPKDVQQLASNLGLAAGGPLQQQTAIALQLKAAIDRYAGAAAPAAKGGWFRS